MWPTPAPGGPCDVTLLSCGQCVVVHARSISRMRSSGREGRRARWVGAGTMQIMHAARERRGRPSISRGSGEDASAGAEACTVRESHSMRSPARPQTRRASPSPARRGSLAPKRTKSRLRCGRTSSEWRWCERGTTTRPPELALCHRGERLQSGGPSVSAIRWPVSECSQ